MTDRQLDDAVGWAMQSCQPTDLVLQALLTAVWWRKPTEKVLVHSDQGSQFTSLEWASFLKHHNLEHSMSRRGNCHDNAVAESFFNLLKREQFRKGMLSPAYFEKQQKWKQQGV